LSVAEILDGAFSLYRRNFASLISIAAVVYVPLGVVQAVLAAALWGTIMRPATNPSGPADAALLTGAAMGGIVFGGLWIVGYALVYAALAVAISHEYLGHEIRLGDAYAQVISRIGPLLLAWIIVALAVAAGVILCVIPGIYFAVALSFASPVVVLEGLGPSAAVGRSHQLVSGYWFRVFGTLLLFSLIVAVIQIAVVFPFGLLFGVVLGASALGQALHQFVSMLASMVLLPLTMTGLIVLYYDLRVRKEAFDLQLMVEQIGSQLGVGSKVTPDRWTARPPVGKAEVVRGEEVEGELVPPPGQVTLPVHPAVAPPFDAAEPAAPDESREVDSGFPKEEESDVDSGQPSDEQQDDRGLY
jgi:hypothetical protein